MTQSITLKDAACKTGAIKIERALLSLLLGTISCINATNGSENARAGNMNYFDAVIKTRAKEGRGRDSRSAKWAGAESERAHIAAAASLMNWNKRIICFISPAEKCSSPDFFCLSPHQQAAEQIGKSQKKRRNIWSECALFQPDVEMVWKNISCK